MHPDSHLHTRRSTIGLQPASAWAAILGLAIPTALCLLVGFSSILQIFFPVGAFLVGIFLYLRYPILYLGFNWWVWFLSPFIARLMEYQNGITDPESRLRLIILAPYLVSFCTAINFFQNIPKYYKREGLPFALAFVSLLYAFLIGFALKNPPVKIIQGFLGWSMGVFMGFYFVVHYRDYPLHLRNTQRVFYWGVLVMGIYGVYQYIVAPEWDKFWLSNSESLSLCCGWPEPLMLRVWSTLNYPFTFAYAMMACLLLLFSRSNLSGIFAIAVGLTAFLLSQVRGAWLGFCVGLLIFFLTVKSRVQIRTTIVIVAVIACLVLSIASSPISDVIVERLQTLTNLKEDSSAQIRQEIYAELFDAAAAEIVGRGLGGQSIIDAGLLDILAILGWLGLVPFVSSIVLLIFTFFKSPVSYFDPSISATCAISLSVLSTLPSNNSLVLLPGVFFWGFAGLTIAGFKYRWYGAYLRADQLPASTSQQI